MEEFSRIEKEIIKSLCSGKVYTTFDHAFCLMPACLCIFGDFTINGLRMKSLCVKGFKVWVGYDDVLKGEDYTVMDAFVTTELRKLVHCFENLIAKGYLHVLKDGLNDWSESNSMNIKGYYDEGESHFCVDFKDISNFFVKKNQISLLITSELFEIYNNDFKSLEQRRYEKDMQMMYRTLFWTRAAFVLTLITAILSLIVNIMTLVNNN